MRRNSTAPINTELSTAILETNVAENLREGLGIGDSTPFREALLVYGRDILDAATTLSDDEARYLVDMYYIWQKTRIRQAHQIRTLAENGEPNRVLLYNVQQAQLMEKQAQAALLRYVKTRPEWPWLHAVCGIGPVIAAGLAAHVKAADPAITTAGKIWRFAGLDPTVKWEKGQKRPWNASLKRLMFLAGCSFVKVKGRDSDFYGKLYEKRKEYEEGKNERLEYAELAALTLQEKNIQEEHTRHAYELGMLPQGRIHMRSMRWTEKLFLSHYHTVCWWQVHHKLPPAPYAFSHLGHADYIAPPYLNTCPGLEEALIAAGMIVKV